MALDYKSGLSRYRRYLQVVRDQPLIRAGIWTAMSLFLVIVMIVMALRPTLVVIANLLGNIKQNKEIISKLNEKIIKLQKATNEMDKISLKLPLLDQALPQTPSWELWTQEISNIASQSGAKLQTINVGPAPIKEKVIVKNGETTTVKPEIKNLSYSFTASGSFDQLKTLINSIENTRRLTILSDIQFSNQKNNEGILELSVYIKGVAVYLPMSNSQL